MALPQATLRFRPFVPSPKSKGLSSKRSFTESGNAIFKRRSFMFSNPNSSLTKWYYLVVSDIFYSEALIFPNIRTTSFKNEFSLFRNLRPSRALRARSDRSNLKKSLLQNLIRAARHSASSDNAMPSYQAKQASTPNSPDQAAPLANTSRHLHGAPPQPPWSQPAASE